MPQVALLWDESHIWGLIAWRALAAWGLPHRLLSASAIAQGALSRNPPAALLVPGGWARAYVEAGGV